jgi:hypothetical protein
MPSGDQSLHLFAMVLVAVCLHIRCEHECCLRSKNRIVAMSGGKEEVESLLHGVERAAIGVLGTMHPLVGMGLSAQCTSRKGAGEDRTLWASHAFSKRR